MKITGSKPLTIEEVRKQLKISGEFPVKIKVDGDKIGVIKKFTGPDTVEVHIGGGKFSDRIDTYYLSDLERL